LSVTNSLGKGLGLAGLGYARLGFAGLGFAPGAEPCSVPVAAGARQVTDAGTGWR
jgi:hypothetical protein